MQAGPLIDDLLRRVRDPQGSAHPRATVRDLLDRSQILFVKWTGTLIRERAFTVTPLRALYDLDPTDTLRILEITRDSNAKRLYPLRWQQLFHQFGPLWWRNSIATGPYVWAHVGTRHFAVHPAPTVLGGSVAVTIRDQRRPAALTADTVELELDADFHPPLLDFVEALLLLRGRDAALVESLAQTEAYVA
jgi:hypothetical protein